MQICSNCNMSNTSATSEERTADPPGAHEVISVFIGFRVAQSYVFVWCFVDRELFVCFVPLLLAIVLPCPISIDGFWYLKCFCLCSVLYIYSIHQGPSWSLSYVSWIYNYLCNQCLSTLKFWVRILPMVRCTLYNSMW